MTEVFKCKPLQASIYDQSVLDCLKNIISEEQKQFLDTDSTAAEIHHVTNKLRETSSPGMDGMTGKIMKHIASRNIDKFTSMVNNYVRDGSARASLFWLKVIPKPGKADYSTLKSYRPI